MVQRTNTLNHLGEHILTFCLITKCPQKYFCDPILPSRSIKQSLPTCKNHDPNHGVEGFTREKRSFKGNNGMSKTQQIHKNFLPFFKIKQ